jgi:DNA-binding CsgD family transcriptional regulator
MTANPCPACHALDQRRARSAEREDPHAEQHLALLAASGDARAAEIYRLWLAGETLSEIARRLDITPQAVDQRFAKIRKRLREVGRGGDCR